MGATDYGLASEVSEYLETNLVERIREDPGVSRRAVLGGLGFAGASALGLGATGPASAGGDHDDDDDGHKHGNFGVRGEYEGGFDPHEFLRTFHTGSPGNDGEWIETDGVRQRTLSPAHPENDSEAGRRIREFNIVATDTDIEIAPGITFQAWTFNGQVPGPTLRVTEGDLVTINFTNNSSHAHTIHPHLKNLDPRMDGIPQNGPGVLETGEEFTYEWIAQPAGVHFYHCHSLPLKEHIHRGLYGTMIVDPDPVRVADVPHEYVPDHPSQITDAMVEDLVARAVSLNNSDPDFVDEGVDADELVMVMNGFDTDFDGDNEVYAVNTRAFAYSAGTSGENDDGDPILEENETKRPIQIDGDQPVRVYLLNTIEFDPINSFHTHSQFFDYYDHGTTLRPTHTNVDTIMQCQAQRGIIELDYSDHEPGLYMFHAHQSEFAELGWMSLFDVQGADGQGGEGG